MSSSSTDSSPTTPSARLSVGLGVLHLFWRTTPLADRDAVLHAIKRAEADGDQVVTIAMLGHKTDFATMVLGPDLWQLRRLQTELGAAGLELVDSYVSITEVSEYAAGAPDAMKQTRLYPDLPPEGKNAWCFYPMSKRRDTTGNWYTLPFEKRNELMYEHGTSGRKYAGRLVQLITASAGLDDYEWGVTLFAQRPDDLKEVVYTMRYDEASAVYAEFGTFYTGVIAKAEEALSIVGID